MKKPSPEDPSAPLPVDYKKVDQHVIRIGEVTYVDHNLVTLIDALLAKIEALENKLKQADPSE